MIKIYSKENIKKLIDDAHINMQKTKHFLGKEIYQKRFKPVYEGYITALCTVLELDENDTTDMIRGTDIKKKENNNHYQNK